MNEIVLMQVSQVLEQLFSYVLHFVLRHVYIGLLHLFGEEPLQVTALKKLRYNV